MIVYKFFFKEKMLIQTFLLFATLSLSTVIPQLYRSTLPNGRKSVSPQAPVYPSKNHRNIPQNDLSINGSENSFDTVIHHREANSSSFSKFLYAEYGEVNESDEDEEEEEESKANNSRISDSWVMIQESVKKFDEAHPVKSYSFDESSEDFQRFIKDSRSIISIVRAKSNDTGDVIDESVRDGRIESIHDRIDGPIDLSVDLVDETDANKDAKTEKSESKLIESQVFEEEELSTLDMLRSFWNDPVKYLLE